MFFAFILAPLIRIEDLGRAVTGYRLVQDRSDQRGIHRIGEPIGEDRFGVPVDDGGKIHKTVLHRNIGDITAPDLVGMVVTTCFLSL